MMTRIQEFLTTQGVAGALAVLYALLIFAVGWLLAGRLARWTVAALERARVEKTVAAFLGSITRVMLLVGVLIAGLSALGVNTNSIVAVLGAAGLAVALALQNSLSNLASGLMIISFRLFRVGDFIEITNATGRVEKIDLFHTTLITADNLRILIPNSTLSTAMIRNYSAFETRRIDLDFAVSFEGNFDRIQAIVTELVQRESRVLAEPEWSLLVVNMTQANLLLSLQVWARANDYWPTRCDLQRALVVELAKAGVTAAYTRGAAAVGGVPASSSSGKG